MILLYGGRTVNRRADHSLGKGIRCYMSRERRSRSGEGVGYRKLTVRGSSDLQEDRVCAPPRGCGGRAGSRGTPFAVVSVMAARRDERRDVLVLAPVDLKPTLRFSSSATAGGSPQSRVRPGAACWRAPGLSRFSLAYCRLAANQGRNSAGCG